MTTLNAAVGLRQALAAERGKVQKLESALAALRALVNGGGQ